MPPSPSIGWGARGTFTLVINSDGQVDSNLTRAWSIGMDTVIYRQLLQTFRRWRFAPGIRGGRPVRTGIPLEVVSDSRNDTLASQLDWRYQTGTSTDTLIGKWMRQPDPAPYSSDRADSVYAAVIRRLVLMQVVLRDPAISHCLIVSSDDRHRHARLTRMARQIVYGSSRRGRFAPMGCERDSNVVRLTLPTIHRTENDRVVVYASGDRLLEWPRSLAGRSWRNWTSRCVGFARARGPSQMDCDVQPTWSRENLDGDPPKILSRRDSADPSSRRAFRLRLRITSSGAYWIDTLQTRVIGPLPSLRANAITDTEPACNSWRATSMGATRDVVLFHGDPGGRDLRVTRVDTARADDISRTTRIGSTQSRPAKLAAFFLGDVGARATAPITLSFPSCGRAYILDPARHTLAQRPHARFRVRDLREHTRVSTIFGTQVFFQLDVDPVPEDVSALVILRDGKTGAYSAWFGWQTAPGLWSYNVMYNDGYPLDSTLSVYLIAP